MRIAVVILLGLIGSCVGLLTIGPALERREVRSLFNDVPGITDLELHGDYDVGIHAVLRTREGGLLALEGVTPESFVPGADLCVNRVGELQALTTGCAIGEGFSSSYWTHCFSLGAEGALKTLLAQPLASVSDAANRYSELQAAFNQTPRCPEFTEFPSIHWPGHLRVCTHSPEAHWPDLSPTQDCKRAQ